MQEWNESSLLTLPGGETTQIDIVSIDFYEMHQPYIYL